MERRTIEVPGAISAGDPVRGARRTINALSDGLRALDARTNIHGGPLDRGRFVQSPQHGPQPWDIVKRDENAGTIWLRPGKLIHNAGATNTDYTAGGNGTDTAGTGLTLSNGTNWIHAKMTVPTSPALTLDVHTGRRSDTATARYWPLWIIEYASASKSMIATLRMGSQDISTTVWQLLSGWSASTRRALDTNTSGVLVWSETGDCEE
jgi:hypothetical protein